MQGRSWMAALTIAAGLTLGGGRPAGADGGATTATADATGAKAGAEAGAVKLELRIAGLGARGCDVEIKPGHPGCSFEAVTRHVERKGELVLLIKGPKTRSADRDCTFAITIKEPGQAERTERRGLRLAKVPGPAQSLSCYLNSPSKLARIDDRSAAKR